MQQRMFFEANQSLDNISSPIATNETSSPLSDSNSTLAWTLAIGIIPFLCLFSCVMICIAAIAEPYCYDCCTRKNRDSDGYESLDEESLSGLSTMQ